MGLSDPKWEQVISKLNLLQSEKGRLIQNETVSSRFTDISCICICHLRPKLKYKPRGDRIAEQKLFRCTSRTFPTCILSWRRWGKLWTERGSVEESLRPSWPPSTRTWPSSCRWVAPSSSTFLKKLVREADSYEYRSCISTVKLCSWKTRNWRRRESGTTSTSQQSTLRWRANMRRGWVLSQLNPFANLYFSNRLKAELVKLRRMYEEETEKAKQEFMYLHSSKVKQSYPVVQVMLKWLVQVEELQEQLSRERSSNSSIVAEMKVGLTCFQFWANLGAIWLGCQTPCERNMYWS